MDNISTLSRVNYLSKVELFATRVISEEFSERLVFHDIEHSHRVISGVKRICAGEGVSDADAELVLIAGWFNNIGFRHLEKWEKFDDPFAFFKHCSKCSIKEAETFLSSIDYPQERIDKVVALLEDAGPTSTPSTHLGKILADAITIEWASKKAKKRHELRYQEFLLLDIISSGKGGFYDSVLGYLQEHEYYTDFGKRELTPKKQELIQKIEKEKKDLNRQEQHVLSKELGITEEEVKKLKKSLKKVSGRDDRGIQTMFRTTSRNHYTLNQMVDRKANILISVNAIIVSLIIGRIIGNFESLCIHSFPIIILMISSMVSIVFAVLAILPTKTHGSFSEQEVRAKQGNLLYFGNYHNMTFRDYNWGMLQMLNDSDYLYTSMIRDLYYLGQQLSIKHRKIRIALGVFIIGIVVTGIAFIIVSSMPDFHFGGAHID